MTTEDEEGTQAMTIRVPKQRHERLRRAAFEKHVTMNELINAAIADYEAAADDQLKEDQRGYSGTS